MVFTDTEMAEFIQAISEEAGKIATNLTRNNDLGMTITHEVQNYAMKLLVKKAGGQ